MGWADDQLAALRPLFPSWDIWYVPLAVGGYVWCAKPAGTPTATINADSPEAVITLIGEQESAQ
jgi:hypothetical protein